LLLRASGDRNNENYILDSVTADKIGESGVGNGEFLMELSAAVYSQDESTLRNIRTRGLELLGARGIADALGIASGFNGITKVANGTGLPLDQSTVAVTEELRINAGINQFSEAFKSNRYDQLA